jgi:hypothetical protein
MHTLTIFPIGNADCCLIDVKDGSRKILFDFANCKNADDEDDLRCDLPALLREELDGTTTLDVVAITHLDCDHYRDATKFFWLEHSDKYQGDDRVKIETLWVPAAVITETTCEDAEGCVIQKEARHRFEAGEGIVVFSSPGLLRDWCNDNGVDLDKRKHLVVDAGKIVPGFTIANDGVEFFVHSPFAKRLNESEVVDRNNDSIVVQATFAVDKVETRVLLLADVTHSALADIVEVTRDKKERPERLTWDIAKLPHHCSYKSLGLEKGEDITEPDENVGWIWTNRGGEHGIIISTSKPIPKKGSDEDDCDQPPHRQAANYYKKVLEAIDGEFVVTMSHPTASNPRPVVIKIDGSKATLVKKSLTAAVAATSRPAPRAG